MIFRVQRNAHFCSCSRLPRFTHLSRTDLFLFPSWPVFSLTKHCDLHLDFSLVPGCQNETALVRIPGILLQKFSLEPAFHPTTCLVTFSSSALIFLDQLPSTAISRLQGLEAQVLLLSASAFISTHLMKYHYRPLSQ